MIELKNDVLAKSLETRIRNNKERLKGIENPRQAQSIQAAIDVDKKILTSLQ